MTAAPPAVGRAAHKDSGIAWYVWSMEQLRRLSDIGQVTPAHGLLIWAAQGRDGGGLGPGVRAWRHGAAWAVASPSRQQNRLAVEGDVADAAVLVRRVLAEAGPSYRVLGGAGLIDAMVRRLPGLAPVHHFFWMETTSPSGVAAEGVRWLDAREEKQTASLFDRFFPDSYAQPGRAGVGRWAGIAGGAGSPWPWSSPESCGSSGISASPRT